MKVIEAMILELYYLIFVLVGIDYPCRIFSINYGNSSCTLWLFVAFVIQILSKYFGPQRTQRTTKGITSNILIREHVNREQSSSTLNKKTSQTICEVS